jgi:O-antigen/teichoic acid export membrane protein
MSLKRGIFFTLLTQAPTLVLFFAASTLITRILGPEGRGAYALLNNQIALLTILFWFNLGSGITYFTSRAGGATRDIVGVASTGLLLNLLLIPLVLLFIHVTPGLREIFMPDMATHWGYQAFIFLSILLGLLQASVSAVLLGLKSFKALNLMSILNAGLSAGGFLVLFFFTGDRGSADSLPAVLWVSAGVLSILAIVWCLLYAVHVKVMPVPVIRWATLRPMLLFSGIGYLSIVVNLINYRFDIWVVDHHQGTMALGLYAVAVGLGQLLFHVPEPFSRVVQPFLYGQKGDEMMGRYRTVARINFTLVLSLAILLALSADLVVPLLFGREFQGSVFALRLLLPGIVFSSASKLLATLVVQRGYQHFNLYATIVGAVVTVFLALLLIPMWGIEGAALASTISYLAILLVVLATIRYKLQLPVHDLFLIRGVDLRLLTSKIPWRVLR